MDIYEKEWYQSLLRKSQKLFLEKISPVFEDNAIPLSDIYIDLNTLSNHKFGIGRHIANSNYSEEDSLSFILPLEQKLADINSNKIVVVGDLGTGKTCLLNHLVGVFSRYRLEQNTFANSFVAKYYDRFVIMVSLKEIEEHIVEKNCIDSIIDAAIIRLVGKSKFKEIKKNLSQYINDGIMLLLDGYDEINENSRKLLDDAVLDFCKDNKNVCIITSRTFTYEHSSLKNNEFFCIKVAPFNKEQIIKLVNKWIDNCSLFQHETTLEKDTRTEQIVDRIFQKQYLMDLASNPLFLTLLLILYVENIEIQNENEFPVGRIRLYEEIICLLLIRWKTKIKISESRELLEEIAYRDIVKNEKNKSDIYPELCAVLNSRYPNQVTDIIKELSEKTGLLISIGENRCAFIHRSFQEYLAAGYIIRKLDVVDFLEKSLDNFTRWKEVDVFLIGKIGLEKFQTAISYLFYFVNDDIRGSNKMSVTTLLMVSNALVELLQLNEKVGLKDFKTNQICNRVRKWLKYYVSCKNIDYNDRFEIGNILAVLDDDRKGVNVNIKEGIITPDIYWINIPAGNCIIGADDNKVNPERFVSFLPFFISKYPITNAQFNVFINSGGYENKNYWTEEGWNWVQGKDIPYMKFSENGRYPEDRQKRYDKWLNARVSLFRKLPFWWREEPWNLPNRPVVGITWYEAVAYCNWLDELYKVNNIYQELNLSPENHQIVLPTAEEWERAARGPKNYKYPWGNKLKENIIKANIDISCINQTSAVGIFSESKSGFGVYDVAGNVYEWTSTGIIKDVNKKYKQINCDLEQSVERLVKGGAWNFEYNRTHCASDDWDYPLIFDQNTGFRPIIRVLKE